MSRLARLSEQLQSRFSDVLICCELRHGDITLEIQPDAVLQVFEALRDEDAFKFETLIDVCGVDYLAYGRDEWATEKSTFTGFSRGVERAPIRADEAPELRNRRFAVVYHLLSLTNNHRLRVRAFVPDDELPVIDSVTGLWSSANWFEREAFDLYGIVFNGHPDMRRILTDYGFIGHPFRKDFPLSGHVEVRYDPEKGRVIYQPVSIEPRVLVPKVIREDHRYTDGEQPESANDA